MYAAPYLCAMHAPEEFWRHRHAPSLDDFEALASRAFSELPEEFRKLTGDVSFAVADFPEDAVLDHLGLESPYDLLGLFHGVGMAHGPATPFTGMMPNRIWLYRRPILEYWAEHDDTLYDIVKHVLIHEIGHHFGLSDEDMEAIEAGAR
jgi:predicted Zn-dependent protease with MMP-like domain